MTKGLFAGDPVIFSVSPQIITVNGENFDSACRVFISNSSASVVGSIKTGHNASGVYVSGNYAYVTKGSSGIDVIDISNPARPNVIDSAHIPGKFNGINVSGNYAYVADYDSGLMVVDISNPLKPGIVGSTRTPSDAFDVKVSWNHAYVSDYAGLEIIDISDPLKPHLTGSVDTPAWIQGVYISGNYAYLAEGVKGLEVIDLNNPDGPIGSARTSDARDVYVSGNYAYVADYDAGLKIINVSDPAKPDVIGSLHTPGKTNGVFVNGNYAYVVYEPLDSQEMEMNDEINYAYDDSLGLLVIDISDKGNPHIAGNIDIRGYAHSVYVSGNYIYMIGDLGLKIIHKLSAGTACELVNSGKNALTAVIPAGLMPGKYNIKVVNSSGEEIMFPDAFSVAFPK